MAPFGKDEKQLDGTPRFGGGRGSRSHNPFAGKGSRGGGGGNFGPFIRNLILHQNLTFWVAFHDKTYRNVVIHPNGDREVVELPYKRIFQHWNNAKGRFAICSGGPDYWNAELSSALCSGCNEYHSHQVQVPDPKRPGKTIRENKGPVGKSEAYGFSVAVLEKFYEVPHPTKKDRDGMPRVEIVLPGSKFLPDAKTPSQREHLSKLQSHLGQRLVFNANRSQHGQIFGVPTPEGPDGEASEISAVTGIDEELRENCIKCKVKGAIEEHENEDVCTACGEVNSRAHLYNTIVRLKVVPGATKQGRDGKVTVPLNLTLIDWLPIDEFFAKYPQFSRETLMEPVDLDKVLAPSPPEQQQQIFGYPPRQTDQGSTEMVDPPGEEVPDEDIPF